MACLIFPSLSIMLYIILPCEHACQFLIVHT